MSQYVFGVDIGGTTVKLGYFDTEGNVLDKWEIPTRKEDNGSRILPDVAASIEKKIKDAGIDRKDVAGVGVGAPGPVDSKGVIYKTANLGWGVFSIKETLENILKLPVMAGNDANVAALGEMWKGGGQGYKDLVVVTLGTGVGGGIIVNGKVLTGANGAGGEIGHIHVEDDEQETCGCGNRGCLEQYSSATGVTRLAKRKLEKTTQDSVLRTTTLSAKSVFDAVKAKDPVAMEIAEQFGQYLGEGLAAIACVTNPEAFVIGGGVSKAGQPLIDCIEKYYQRYAFPSCKETPIVLATLGNDAGIYGAAKMVL